MCKMVVFWFTRGKISKKTEIGTDISSPALDITAFLVYLFIFFMDAYLFKCLIIRIVRNYSEFLPNFLNISI